MHLLDIIDKSTVINEDIITENSGLWYKGYPCTIDCSGHAAGFEWAKEKNITDVAHCDSHSNSFNEGCLSFVRFGW
jgi:hypothetical protein